MGKYQCNFKFSLIIPTLFSSLYLGEYLKNSLLKIWENICKSGTEDDMIDTLSDIWSYQRTGKY